MRLIKINFTFMNINFFYLVPIILFGSIYLINLSKNVVKISLNQKVKKS